MLKPKVQIPCQSRATLANLHVKNVLFNAQVFYGDVDAETGAATLKLFEEKYGSENVKFQHFDVTDKKGFEDAFKQAVDSFGHIDVLVNNAGIVKESQWELSIYVNVTAVIFGTYLATEHMRKDKGGKGGRIINISSTAGLESYLSSVSVYTGTKHAVRAFTTCMANQLDIEELGVEYGVLCPGVSDTQLLRCLDDTVLSVLLRELKVDTVPPAMPVQKVADALMELITQEKMNGAILCIDIEEKYYVKLRTEKSETWNPQ